MARGLLVRLTVAKSFTPKTALSMNVLDACVHGGAELRMRDITLEGTPPPFWAGSAAASQFGDLQAAQHLVREPGLSTVTYGTAPGPGTFILGSYSQDDLARDVRDGRFTINEGVSRDRLDQATSRADSMFDEAVQTHESILQRQDPNDEGYAFFDQNARAEQAYRDLEPLRDEYNAGRYVTANDPLPNFETQHPEYPEPQQEVQPEYQPQEAPTQTEGGTGTESTEYSE